MTSSGLMDTPHPQVPHKYTSLSPGICPHQLLKSLCSGSHPSVPTQHTQCQLGQDLAAEPSPRQSPRLGRDWTLSPSTASCRLWALAQRPGVRDEGLAQSMHEVYLWEGTCWPHTPCVAVGNSSRHRPTPQHLSRVEVGARDPQTPSETLKWFAQASAFIAGRWQPHTLGGCRVRPWES